MTMNTVILKELDMAVDRAGSKAELSRRICRSSSFISQVYGNGLISDRDARQILTIYGINVIGKDIPQVTPSEPKESEPKRRSSKSDKVAISVEKLNDVIEKAGSKRVLELAIGSKSHGYICKVIEAKQMNTDAVEIIKERWGIDVSKNELSEPETPEVEITKNTVGRFSWYGKELLEIFDSKEQACKKFGSNVEKVLNKEWSYCYGYRFEYLLNSKRKDLKLRHDISLTEPIGVVNEDKKVILFDNYDSYMSYVFSRRSGLGSAVAQVEYDLRMILRGEKEPTSMKWFRKTEWIGYWRDLPKDNDTSNILHFNGSIIIPAKAKVKVQPEPEQVKAENIEKPAEVIPDQDDIQKQILDGINELIKIGRAQNDYLRNISAKLDNQHKVSTDTRDILKSLDGLFPAIMDQIRRAR